MLVYIKVEHGLNLCLRTCNPIPLYGNAGLVFYFYFFDDEKCWPCINQETQSGVYHINLYWLCEYVYRAPKR